MLQDTHQLDMGVFHLLEIFHDSVSELPVVVEAVLRSVGMLHEGTDMTLIYCHGLFVEILLLAQLHPLAVLPAEAGQISDDGGCAGAEFCLICKGVSLVMSAAVLGVDQELVHISYLSRGDEYPPDSHRSQLLHGMCGLIPVIEGTDHINFLRIRGPDAEIDSLLTVFTGRMRTQLFVNVVMCSLGKQILVSL